MERLKAEDINLHIKMRFIGYYMSEEQFMRTETVFPEEAEILSGLLRTTFDSFLNNKYVDEEMKGVLRGNSVFILKGEDKRLYGYYPKYNIARITKVRYSKPSVVPMPSIYKRWFYPGDRFKVYTHQTNDNVETDEKNMSLEQVSGI